MGTPFKPSKPRTAADKIPKTIRNQDEVIPVSKAQKNKTRADFRIEEFRRVIRQKGYFLRWRKALLCPCLNKETDSPEVDCTICDHTGVFYIEPIEIQGLMMGLEKKKDVYRHLGEWLEGSAMLTVEPEHRLGYQDSLEMIHSISIFNEYIKKGNRRGPRTRLPASTDAARYRIVRVVHMMYSVNDRPVALELGVHFTITKEGWIQWTSLGQQIPDGTILSLNYEFHPTWMVMSHPHAIRDTLNALKSPEDTVFALPLQVAVKLDYLASQLTLPSTGVV